MTIRKTAARAATASIAALSLSACATASNSLPDGAVISPDNPAIAYVPVGKNERGCTAYTKRSLEPGITTDAAIWFRDTEGRFVLNAKKCVPEED